MKGGAVMFSINLQSREPIYEQLYKNVVRLISLNVLPPQSQLPSVRQLASQLGVNPNTVSKAYQLLERDGLIYSVIGKGSFISPGEGAVLQQKNEAMEKIKKALSEACALGFSKDELLSLIDEVFIETKKS